MKKFWTTKRQDRIILGLERLRCTLPLTRADEEAMGAPNLDGVRARFRELSEEVMRSVGQEMEARRR